MSTRLEFLHAYGQEGRHYNIDKLIDDAHENKDPNAGADVFNTFYHKLNSDQIDKIFDTPHNGTSFGINQADYLKGRIAAAGKLSDHKANQHFKELDPYAQAEVVQNNKLTSENIAHAVRSVKEGASLTAHNQKRIARGLIAKHPLTPDQIDTVKKVMPAETTGLLLTHNKTLSRESIEHAWNTHMTHSYLNSTLPQNLHMFHNITDEDREYLRKKMKDDMDSLHGE